MLGRIRDRGRTVIRVRVKMNRKRTTIGCANSRNEKGATYRREPDSPAVLSCLGTLVPFIPSKSPQFELFRDLGQTVCPCSAFTRGIADPESLLLLFGSDLQSSPSPSAPIRSPPSPSSPPPLSVWTTSTSSSLLLFLRPPSIDDRLGKTPDPTTHP